MLGTETLPRAVGLGSGPYNPVTPQVSGSLASDTPKKSPSLRKTETPGASTSFNKETLAIWVALRVTVRVERDQVSLKDTARDSRPGLDLEKEAPPLHVPLAKGIIQSYVIVPTG